MAKIFRVLKNRTQASTARLDELKAALEVIKDARN